MRLREKAKSALLVSALAVLFGVSGCTTTKYVAIEPECTAPAKPVLPDIDKGGLWGVFVNSQILETVKSTENIELSQKQVADAEARGDAEYRNLETYINRLWAYSDQQAAIIGELCDAD